MTRGKKSLSPEPLRTRWVPCEFWDGGRWELEMQLKGVWQLVGRVVKFSDGSIEAATSRPGYLPLTSEKGEFASLHDAGEALWTECFGRTNR